MTQSAHDRTLGRLAVPMGTTKIEGACLLLLVTLLVAANWLFLGRFVVGSIAVGACVAIVMRRWHTRHPSPLPYASRSRVPEINLSAIPVGGDAGGLVFAIGSTVVVILGIPGVSWYVLGALACGLLVGGLLFASRSAQSWQALRGTSLGRL